MTPRIDNEARIDVLRVLEKHHHRIPSHKPRELDEMAESRAAVAELIAAAKELCEFPYDDPPQGRLWAALARCGVTR